MSPQAALNDTELHAVLSDFESYAEKGRKDWQVPGMAIAIVRGNDTIYMHCFGVKNINGTDPVTNNTIFQIGSTSKAFTTALVAMQVDEGNVSWDDRVIDHLPDFRMYDPWVTREFTITDLTAQDSGMPGHAGDQLAIIGYNRSCIKHAARYLKPVASFRSAFAYQNNLFLWAAALVENKTGRSWEDNIHDGIFLPLNMANSTTGIEPFQQANDVASLHVMENGTVKALPMGWKYLDWVYIYGPAGGINSNIIDMTKWIRHKGGTSGHHSMVAFMPGAKLGIVVLSNAGYTGLPEALAYLFFEMYFGNSVRDWSAEALNRTLEAQNLTNARIPKRPESPSSALPLDRYAGNYSNEIYGQINVTAKENSLVAAVGPVKMQLILKPWNRDIFSVSTPDFYDYPGFASFYFGLNGRADSVTLDAFNDAIFNRV